MMKKNTSTKTTRKGSTIQERTRKDGTTSRKRTNTDGSVRTSKRNADGTLKSATRKTSAGGAVKSMKRGGQHFNSKSARVTKRNSATGVARAAKRKAK